MAKMNELKFNSQICTTKIQSQRLLDLGLKPYTSDMCWLSISDVPSSIGYIDLEKVADELKFNIIPAWSLHRLIELGGFNVECKGLFWRVTGTYFSESCNKIYDNIIDSIEALITENLFNKEYLKQ